LPELLPEPKEKSLRLIREIGLSVFDCSVSSFELLIN